jgi:hypothetical protein
LVYVADRPNNRIQVFRTNGWILTPVPGANPPTTVVR